jgi:hypothetical protein
MHKLNKSFSNTELSYCLMDVYPTMFEALCSLSGLQVRYRQLNTMTLTVKKFCILKYNFIHE